MIYGHSAYRDTGKNVSRKYYKNDYVVYSIEKIFAVCISHSSVSTSARNLLSMVIINNITEKE